jgi:hypothetical protein
MRPLGKVKIQWSPGFAYAIGLLATDGCLSSDGRHIDLTSKDEEQILNFRTCLSLQNKISKKSSGSEKEKKYFHIEFGDINFYGFLNEIGLTPNKSKTMPGLLIPPDYFFDFLRGSFDGDGCFYSYWDPRWLSSYMFYLTFNSASKIHIDWLQAMVHSNLNIKGHISKSMNDPTYKLKYAKAESLKLLPKMYYNERVVCLSRKRQKIEAALKVIGLTI